ncbi:MULTISPECIES: phosphonate metabolism transcriptional regulator PhnF [unclassified Shimia]|uniref:phosphonate metabolism transcriptional regulator PhnF n=1 Tax=unclassified Shimia TaxID=2630038 RepID=UPI00310AD267
MTRTNWTMIRDALADDIASGQFNTGDKLPTEPQLATRFDAGRHSVRRAVEALAKEGKVSIEQGRGTFVEEAPRLTYTIGKRTRLSPNLVPQGCVVSSAPLAGDIVEATDRLRAALKLSAGEKVVSSQRITFADGLPIAFGTAWYSADRFPDFVARRETLNSVTKTFQSYGIDDYHRIDTEFFSRPARTEEAKTLRQHPDLPVMVVRATDADPTGAPISHSKVIWASGRVKFTISGQGDG